MKYLKKFENNKKIMYHKNDIVVVDWHKTDEIFLVLNDTYDTDDKLFCIYIGCISNLSESYYSIFFNKDAVKKEYKNIDAVNSFREITNLELNMMCNVIFSDETKVNYFIDVIEEMTGINLKKLPILTDHKIKMSANKFNI